MGNRAWRTHHCGYYTIAVEQKKITHIARIGWGERSQCGGPVLSGSETAAAPARAAAVAVVVVSEVVAEAVGVVATEEESARRSSSMARNAFMCRRVVSDATEHILGCGPMKEPGSEKNSP